MCGGGEGRGVGQTAVSQQSWLEELLRKGIKYNKYTIISRDNLKFKECSILHVSIIEKLCNKQNSCRSCLVVGGDYLRGGLSTGWTVHGGRTHGVTVREL